MDTQFSSQQAKTFAVKIGETAIILSVGFGCSAYLALIAKEVGTHFLAGEAVTIIGFLIAVATLLWMVCLYLLRGVWRKKKVPSSEPEP